MHQLRLWTPLYIATEPKPVFAVVVYDTIALLNISIDMPTSQNCSNLSVSPRFSAPRYDTYCKIWV